MQVKQEPMTEKKYYLCKCGMSYERNSSLFNHIKIKHNNNKQYFLYSQSRVGRPTGQKNIVPKEKIITKVPSKSIKCKCGAFLKGEGAFNNHVKGIHQNDPFYKQERKQQGRKKTIQNDVSSIHDNYNQTDIQRSESIVQNQYQEQNIQIDFQFNESADSNYTQLATYYTSTPNSQFQDFTPPIYFDNDNQTEEMQYQVNNQTTQNYEFSNQNMNNESYQYQYACDNEEFNQQLFNQNYYYSKQNQESQEEEEFIFFDLFSKQ